eukprot:91264-Pleurochrysis_carterae.AAC.1
MHDVIRALLFIKYNTAHPYLPLIHPYPPNFNTVCQTNSFRPTNSSIRTTGPPTTTKRSVMAMDS